MLIPSAAGLRRCLSQSWAMRRYATEAPSITGTNRAEATKKRFWKTVGIDRVGDGYVVTLDRRPLKTPSGNPLLLPESKHLVATLIAAEWENQEIILKPHALPMTSIAARAVDALQDERTRSEVHASILNYVDTDTICFHHDEPPPLVTLQQRHWDPLLSWARMTFDIEIHTFTSILFNSQPDATKKRLEGVLRNLDHWEMAAMERAAHTTKSFIISLALVKKHLTVDQASLASQAEVTSQIQRWGEVEDSHDVDFHDIRRQLGSATCLLCSV